LRPAVSETGDGVIAASEIAALKANVAHLQQDLDALKASVAKLCAELGTRVP
jgi:ubiquinone biosynthesis protein UbiJ